MTVACMGGMRNLCRI